MEVECKPKVLDGDVCIEGNQHLEEHNFDILSDCIFQITFVSCDMDLHYIDNNVLNTHIVEIKKKNNDVVHKL